MSLKDFEIGKELGKGAFGSVSIVKRKEDGLTYAMKRVKISQLSTRERENALNEVRILASLSHPNIIGYKEAFFDEESKTLNIVMEFADDGDLETKIKQHSRAKTGFKEGQIWEWVIQALRGLKFLHDNQIMHRDLKCANIFLMKNGLVKLGDLNVSKITKMGMAYTQTGTPYYASPEVWAEKPYDYKSDIWSLGCIIYEICTLRPPFRGSSLSHLYLNVKKGKYDPIPASFSKDLANIIGLMLLVNPSLRPTCDTLLSNDILTIRMLEGQNSSSNTTANLIETIKLPQNMNDINRALPKQKRYQLTDEFNNTDTDQQYKLESKKASMENMNAKAIFSSSPNLLGNDKKIDKPKIKYLKKNKSDVKDLNDVKKPPFSPNIRKNINVVVNLNVAKKAPVAPLQKKDRQINKPVKYKTPVVKKAPPKVQVKPASAPARKVGKNILHGVISLELQKKGNAKNAKKSPLKASPRKIGSVVKKDKEKNKVINPPSKKKVQLSNDKLGGKVKERVKSNKEPIKKKPVSASIESQRKVIANKNEKQIVSGRL